MSKKKQIRKLKKKVMELKLELCRIKAVFV